MKTRSATPSEWFRDLRACSALWDILLLVFVCGCRADNPPLNVLSYGDGSYRYSQEEAFGKPFQAASGIPVVIGEWDSQINELERLSGESLNWHVLEVSSALFERGKELGAFAPVPRGLVKRPVSDALESPFGVPAIYWATVLAWADRETSSSSFPDWATLWDIDKYPGWRGLRDDPRGSLEIALLGDGVDAEALYPLDTHRALRRLELIEQCILWWSSGDEPIAWLKEGQVRFSSVWSGRLFAGRRSGALLASSWQKALIDLDWWVLPANSTRKKDAIEFLKFASEPGRQADQAQRVGYGPVSLDALPLVAPAVREELPTASHNWSRSIEIDSQWWARNESFVMETWVDWRARSRERVSGSCR